MGEKRVVWILGAGFSRPLGGPLLDDLLKEQLEVKLRAAASARAADNDEVAKLVGSIRTLRQIYEGGSPPKPGSVPWTNAEEFLEFLDMARSGVPTAVAMLRASLRLENPSDTGERAARFGKLARHYLALATHHFVDEPDAVAKLERWQPYRRWATKLQPTDHVISFNYDLVVERCGAPVQLFVPGDRAPLEFLTQGTTLIKPHGSLSWVRNVGADGSEEMLDEPDPWRALREQKDFAIAGPGPYKFEASNGIFAAHWQLACEVIKQANAIVMVGYRMPESDAFARDAIMTAIAQSQHNPNVYVVLGPTRDHHVARLEGMLGWLGIQGIRMQIPPMWSQDFLALFDRGVL